MATLEQTLSLHLGINFGTDSGIHFSCIVYLAPQDHNCYLRTSSGLLGAFLALSIIAVFDEVENIFRCLILVAKLAER